MKLSCIAGMVCLLVQLLLVPRGALAETFHDNVNRFSLEIAPGWKRLPDAELRKMDASVAQRAQASQVAIQFAAAYSRGVNDRIPYFTISVLNSEGRMGGSFSEIARGFIHGMQESAAKKTAVKQSGGALQSLSVGDVNIDESNHRIMSCADLKVSGSPIRSTLVTYVSAIGFVQFTLYSRPDQAAADAQALQTMLESFRFDPGAEFVSSNSSGSAYDVGTLAGRITAVVLLVALVLFIVKKTARK